MTEHPFDHGAREIRGEHLAAHPRQPEEIRQHIADYYAMITHLDSQIGRILEALKATGQDENTIVVYTSDHGLALGQHGLMAKQCMYDHSIRVPWVMSGPNIPSGKQINALTYQFDIFPTLCELSGIDVPETVGCVSMVQELQQGDTTEQRHYVYSLYKDVQRGIKDFRWKLIVYRKSPVNGQGTDEQQLFDLQKDPWETNNLAKDLRYKPQIERLYKALRKEMDLAGDPFW